MIDLNPNVPPPTPPTRTPSPIGLAGIVVLACVAAFAGGVFATTLWDEFSEVWDADRDDVNEMVKEEEVVEDETQDEAEVEEVVFASTDEVLQIDWIDPELQPSADVAQSFLMGVCYGEDAQTGETYLECEYRPEGLVNWSYTLGTVRGGTYDGRDLVMATVPFQDLGTNYGVFYLLIDSQQPQEFVLLNYLRSHGSFSTSWIVTTLAGRFGEDWVASRLGGVTIDSTATIPDLEFEQMYHDTNGNEYFFTGYWHRLYSEHAISMTASTKSVARIDGGTLRLYEPKRDAEGQLLEGQSPVGENQYFDVDEDGRVLFYDLRPPFFDYHADHDGNILSYAMGRPLVSWDDGTTSNEDTYFKGTVSGCGFTNVTTLVPQSTIDTLGLVKTGDGLGKGGETYPVYEPSSYDQKYYEELLTIVYLQQNAEEPKTYDDFDHPFFYYQDGLGRWIEFMSNEIVPPLECGKPVIYLYPESMMDMSVWVSPRGGFTYTEPEYGDGWEVTAYPDGRIVNQKDGREYPYLFWEGRGGLYSPVETYWVIERAGVESFLQSTLGSMNFNQQEIADFVEFWLPRMQNANYYKIGFHGTNVMDQLAPLSLSVKPHHVFRILMDYEELDVWQPSHPPARLPRANRDGFEVMEWGGVLR
jgi:hypothetical protein